MAKINVNNNLNGKPNYSELIPLGKFYIDLYNNDNKSFILSSLSNISGRNEDVNIPYDYYKDRLFIFLNNKLIDDKPLNFNGLWNINIDNENQNHNMNFPVISVMVYPSTLYKLKNIKFENNHLIRAISDFYTFNLYNLTGMLKNCGNLTHFMPLKFGPSIINDDCILILDYAFANCFNLIDGPSIDSKNRIDYMYDNNLPLSLNYALMNTPKIYNKNIINGSNIKVHKNGGKGIFFNSSLPSLPNSLDLSNVYDLRSTFSQTSYSDISNTRILTLSLNNAKLIDNICKESMAFDEIVLNNIQNIQSMDNAFKDNITFTKLSTNISSNINLTNAISIYSGSDYLVSMPTVFKFTNSEFVIDVFKDCMKLTTFYNPDYLNAKIISGVYKNCKLLSSIGGISGSGLELPNVLIINDLFNGANSLLSETSYPLTINSSANVEADAVFNACESLTTEPSIVNNQNILSSACLYKDCINITSIGKNPCINSKNTSGMYKNCKNATNYSDTNTSSVIASSMFEDCIALNQGSFNLYNTLFASRTFRNCNKLTNITGINNFKTLNALDISNMCEGCVGLSGTPTIIDTSKAELLVGTYKGCTNIKTVDLNLSNARNADNIVSGCSSLNTINISIDDKEYNRFPNLDFRGTVITDTNVNNIAQILPDMSKYLDYDTSTISSITWSTSYDTVDISLNEEYKLFKSSKFTLVPGTYKLQITSDYDLGIIIVKNSDNIPMNAPVYNNSTTNSLDIDIDENTTYYLYASTPNNTITNDVFSIKWYAPYFYIDIRYTPADTDTDNTLNAIYTLNDKGWNVLSTGLGAQTINNIEQDISISSNLTLQKGYYTIYSEANTSDKIKVYQIIEGRENLIASSHSNEYSVSFILDCESEIIIQCRSNNEDDLIIKKI